MNIQIFGQKKCFGTKCAQRFFSERKIKVQLIDILDKGISARELDTVISVLKDIDALLDTKSPPYERLNMAYITRSTEDKKALILTNPALLKTPIVRDCDTKKCTVGQQETIWRTWL